MAELTIEKKTFNKQSKHDQKSPETTKMKIEEDKKLEEVVETSPKIDSDRGLLHGTS